MSLEQPGIPRGSAVLDELKTLLKMWHPTYKHLRSTGFPETRACLKPAMTLPLFCCGYVGVYHQALAYCRQPRPYCGESNKCWIMIKIYPIFIFLIPSLVLKGSDILQFFVSEPWQLSYGQGRVSFMENERHVAHITPANSLPKLEAWLPTQSADDYTCRSEPTDSRRTSPAHLKSWVKNLN